ncbi:MAG: hypothetical protein K1Y36_19235 [Blastocatellia bacterium]|nr:hypothetical protein [Blastocatellia bacterium]
MRALAKFFLTPVFFSLLWCAGGVAVQAAEPVQVAVDSTQWVIKDQKAKTEEFLGRKSLYLTSGFAVLKEVDFENGVIEVDIAAPSPRSFIGISFRGQSEADFETVYFRPHKSGLEDAVQYAPSFNGSTAWQLFSGKGFTAAAEIPKGQWIHVRLEITGLSGKVYFNHSEKPVLEIEDLKHGYSHGTLGIWGSANGGYFSNFTYRIDPVASRPERRPNPPAQGILTKWELSEAFDVAVRDLETPLSSAELKAMKWQAVEAEAPGMVVIDRYRRSPDVVRFFATPAERTGKREGRKLVLARTVIESDRDQIKKMSLGYSDEVAVFLNLEPVFTGKSAFRFRDPGFLGIMDVEDDAVYLHLKKGRNELVLAVADYFGGWGFICRMDECLRK